MFVGPSGCFHLFAPTALWSKQGEGCPLPQSGDSWLTEGGTRLCPGDGGAGLLLQMHLKAYGAEIHQAKHTRCNKKQNKTTEHHVSLYTATGAAAEPHFDESSLEEKTTN